MSSSPMPRKHKEHIGDRVHGHVLLRSDQNFTVRLSDVPASRSGRSLSSQGIQLTEIPSIFKSVERMAESKSSTRGSSTNSNGCGWKRSKPTQGGQSKTIIFTMGRLPNRYKLPFIQAAPRSSINQGTCSSSISYQGQRPASNNSTLTTRSARIEHVHNRFQSPVFIPSQSLFPPHKQCRRPPEAG